MAKYEAKNLGEVADYFELLASDCEAVNARRYGTKQEQTKRAERATVWKEAADMLRNMELTG